MIRGYSKDYAIKAGIPLSEYHFPAEPGECDATLTMKIWGKHKNLLCYFDTDEGERLLLCVWFSTADDRSYRPQNSDLDLSYVEIGSRLHIQYGISSSGKSQFLDAELLE